MQMRLPNWQPLLRRRDRAFDIDTARARIKESRLPFDVRYIQIPALAISSTNIRKRVARGMSVRYLTSESVLGYIRKRGGMPILGKTILIDGGERCR